MKTELKTTGLDMEQRAGETDKEFRDRHQTMTLPKNISFTAAELDKLIAERSLTRNP